MDSDRTGDADFLAVLHDELLAAESGRGRSAQVETGASQAHGCRAEAVLRLNRVEPSDPRLSWDAWVGNAIHERLARMLEAEGRLVEQQYSYRGVKATIDRADVLGLFAGTLTDYKSKGSGGDIAVIRRDGPRYDAIAQIHLGAAALIEAGHEVTHVQLCFVPRDGDLLRDGYVWGPVPFDRAIADKAVEAVEESNALAVDRTDLPILEMVDGLRDKPPSFCWTYCPHVRNCRGEPPDAPPVDEGVADVAAEYLEAKRLEEEGKARAKRARKFLDDYPDLRSVGLLWTGGNPLEGEEVDMDAVRFLLGGDLPMKPKEGTSNRTLRRIK